MCEREKDERKLIALGLYTRGVMLKCNENSGELLTEF